MLGSPVADALGDVVELAGFGGRDEGLDVVGVVLELGDDGRLGEVEPVVAGGRCLGEV